MPQPALRLPPADDTDAAYVAHTSHGLARALAGSLAAFDEPRAADPTRALRLLGLLVEPLVGFALGSIAAQLATATRRWFGDEASRAVLGALRGHLAPAAPAWDERIRYLADADTRPLVDELGARLHARFCRAPIAGMVATTRATVARLAPQRIASLATALELATRDDLLGARLGDELAAGWAQYRAALAGQTAPTTSPLWSAWSRKVRGEAEPQCEHRGYIMLVR